MKALSHEEWSDSIERLGDVSDYIFRGFNAHGKTNCRRRNACRFPLFVTRATAG
jgi:hypothetical protein